MKKSLTVLVLTFVCVFTAFSYSLSLGCDTGSIQDLFEEWSDGSGQITLDARGSVSDTFSLRLPLSVTFNERSSMFESGVDLVYYPWSQGPFVSMTLIRFGLIAGTTSFDRTSFGLNEIGFGWTFAVSDNLLIEPSVSLRDPSGIYTDEYSALKGEYPCYKTVRAHLTVCWQVWENDL